MHQITWEPGIVLFGWSVPFHEIPETGLVPVVSRTVDPWVCSLCHVESPELVVQVDAGDVVAHVHCWMNFVKLREQCKAEVNIASFKNLFFQATAHAVSHHMWAILYKDGECHGLDHVYGCACVTGKWRYPLHAQPFTTPGDLQK